MPSGVISAFSRIQNLVLEMRVRFLQGKFNTCPAYSVSEGSETRDII